MADAINFVQDEVPSLFTSDNKIKLYSRAFAHKVEVLLNEIAKRKASEALSDKKTHTVEIPKYIREYFSIESNFTPQENSYVFMERKNYEEWLSDINNQSEKYKEVRTKIDVNVFSKYKYPYIYQDDDGRYYLIQNIGSSVGSKDPDESKLKAINVARIWTVSGINIGGDVDPYDISEYGDVPVHIIYGISRSEDLIVLSDRSNGAPNPLLLLDYGTGPSPKFAAILRL